MHILKWKVCMNFGNCYWTIVGPVVLCFNLVETSVHRLIFDDDDDDDDDEDEDEVVDLLGTWGRGCRNAHTGHLVGAMDGFKWVARRQRTGTP